MSIDNPHREDKAAHISKRLRVKEPTCIVGVGASAGGLSALKSFVANFPADLDAAVIIVQHLSPDFETLMDEVLEKHCHMPIKLADDLEPLEANTIYLLPARQNLSIGSNQIILSDVDSEKLHHPIDYLFRSIAEERQNDAVGVVLSGTGSDGSSGVLELRKVGALCVVQEPASAEFDGMPNSAIATGKVDLILTPDEMGPQIAAYLQRKRDNDSGALATEGKNLKLLHTLFDSIREHSRVDLGAYKLSTVERRVKHRMGILGIETLKAYVDYLIDSEKERDLLVQDISIGVTQFFRNPEVWTLIGKQVVERMLLEAEPTAVLRIWVPGCSTGEEAYTLSILFEEAMERLGERRDVRIFASDIDRAATHYAGQGRFPELINQDVPRVLLKKYFDRVDDGYVVIERIRKRVVFAAHNLLEDPPFSNMDLVSCRNLLIYFQVHAQKEILSFLHFAMKPNGYLILGEAESTSTMPEYFVELDRSLHLYQRAKNTRVSLSSIGLDERMVRRSVSLKKQLVKRESMRSFDGTIPRIKENLFNHFVPATLVLDSAHNLVFSCGNTDAVIKKLQPGTHSLHYGRVLQDSLVSVVASLIKQVDQRKQRVLLTDVKVPEVDLVVSIDAAYQPLSEGVQSGHYLFSFLEQGASLVTEGENEPESADSQNQLDMRIRQLDSELLDARVLLGEKQQDVEALTEELHTTNEALMASNEELQSTNEELQSVNEELFTVNNEYQEKILELQQSNQDLDSLLNATDVGVVYLDKHFLIRRFTPKTRDYINLLPLDINRPFTDITLNFDLQDVEGLLSEVKRRQQKRNYIISMLRGQKSRLLLTALPYLENSGNLEGIILVFQDLDAFEKAAQEAQTA